MATTAEIYAQAKRDEAAKQLENLYADTDKAYNQQVDAAKANTQNILNQLTQSATDYQNQYEKDARSAYINRMQNERTVENNLARLGLGDSGYGVTQRLMPATDYGKNLTTLQDALSKNLLGIDQSKATANTELGNTLATLASNYAQNKQQTQMNVFDRLQDVYNNAYAAKYQEEQDALAQAAARSYSSGGSGRSYSSGGGSSSSGSDISLTNSGGYFSNGYQPNNVDGSALHGSGKTVNDVFTGAPVSGSQKVWKSDAGRYYVWIGTGNKSGYYVDVTDKYNTSIKKKQATIW